MNMAHTEYGSVMGCLLYFIHKTVNIFQSNRLTWDVSGLEDKITKASTDIVAKVGLPLANGF